METLIGVSITGVLGVIASVVSYRLGRRAKVDEIVLSKGYPIAEEVAKLFQDIAETDEHYSDVYEREFLRYPTLEDAMDRAFLRLDNLYDADYKRISAHMDARTRLYDQLKVARLYLKTDVLDTIAKYLDIGLFTYTTDGGILHGFDEFHTEFFRNISDPEKHRLRIKLSKAVIKKLRTIVKL